MFSVSIVGITIQSSFKCDDAVNLDWRIIASSWKKFVLGSTNHGQTKRVCSCKKSVLSNSRIDNFVQKNISKKQI